MDGRAMQPELFRKLGMIYSGNKQSIHFLWECNERRVTSLGGRLDFAGVENPFVFFLEKELIDPDSKPFYEIFMSHIMDAIWDGCDSANINADVKMKLWEGDESCYCHIYTNLLKDENGRVTDIHANVIPFHEKEVFDREVLDFFTSDKNPAIFTKRCVDAVNRGTEGKLAFIQFDVDGFKFINDKYGADTGDEILKFIGDSLKVLCNERQPCARLTADVFMLVTEFETTEELIRLIHLLESRLSYYKGIEYRLVFGVSIVNDKTKSTRHYGDAATLARKSVKGTILENISFYQEEMIGSLQKTRAIEEDMHKAVLNNEFVMYLQPKYSISSGRIIGAEALARWIHHERGMISPAEFIPVFEQNGFIIKLDRIIWEEACKKIRSWIDSGIKAVPISVNVSREYLSNEDVIEIITSLTEKYNIPHNLFQLEITETVENSNVRDIVAKFKECGFTMLMDDFGSGYSSLNMLKSTQFDVLKIDRGFFSEFMESDRGRKIITHTISMSQDIGLDIIAEGVETNEQAAFLSKCGCDAAQGFLYSRPVPHKDVDAMLPRA